MKIGNRITYAHVLDIPESTHGDVSIVHNHKPAGTTMESTNLRTALFGQKGGTVTFPQATRWHELTEKGYGTWMTDYPIEQRQHDEMLIGAHGRVLVGGLGLGYAVVALARKPRVRHIVVVERSPSVIALVWNATILNVRSFRERCTLQVVCDDIHHYVDTTPSGHFDWAFFDTWQADGEATFHDTVVPLRRAARAKRVPVVRCWNEDIMRGQLLNGLDSRLRMIRMVRDVDTAADETPESHQDVVAMLRKSTDLDKLATPDGTCWIDWAAPFWAWYRDVDPDDATANQAAMFYAQQYGNVSDRRLTAALHVGWRGRKATPMSVADLCG